MTQLPQAALDLIEAKAEELYQKSLYYKPLGQTMWHLAASQTAQWALTNPEVLKEAGLVKKIVFDMRVKGVEELFNERNALKSQLAAAQNKIIALEGKLNEK